MKFYVKYTFVIALFLSLFSCRTGGGFDSITLTMDELAIRDERRFIPRKESRFKDDINIAVLYRVTWTGLHVGDLVMEIKPVSLKRNGDIKDDIYRVQTVISSYGIARFISGFQSNTIGIIKRDGEGEFSPVNYQTSFKLRKKRRDIKLVYSEDGKNVVEESNHPPEKRWKRPAVPGDMKVGATDPLTLALMARTEIMKRDRNEELKQEFSLPLYDGRRRTDVHFTIHKRNEKGHIHVSFKESPVAGYTDNELKRIAKRNAVIHVYLSPRNYMPLGAAGESFIGLTKLTAIKKCKTFDECMNKK